jgi:hypothetical protein
VSLLVIMVSWNQGLRAQNQTLAASLPSLKVNESIPVMEFVSPLAITNRLWQGLSPDKSCQLNRSVQHRLVG